MTPHIRWLISLDNADVLGIDRLSFDDPWDLEHLRGLLRRRNCIGMVAEGAVAEGRYPVLGWMVYELYPDRIELLRLAVHPDCRRLGVGLALLDKLAGKLSPHRRTAVTLAVPDTLLDAHLWLRACGFRAVDVERGEGDARDHYRFEFRLPGPASDADAPAEWLSARWRERAIALLEARCGPGHVLAVDSMARAIRGARPLARCLPDPALVLEADGRPRLGWSRRGRTVFLRDGGIWGPVVAVHPLPFPHHISRMHDPAGGLGLALDWAFGDGAPDPSTADAEDRSC